MELNAGAFSGRRSVEASSAHIDDVERQPLISPVDQPWLWVRDRAVGEETVQGSAGDDAPRRLLLLVDLINFKSGTTLVLRHRRAPRRAEHDAMR